MCVGLGLDAFVCRVCWCHCRCSNDWWCERRPRTQNICCLGGEYCVLIFFFVSVLCCAVRMTMTVPWKLSRSMQRANRSIFPLFIQSFKIELHEITAANRVYVYHVLHDASGGAPIVYHSSGKLRQFTSVVLALQYIHGGSWTTFCRWCKIECAQSSSKQWNMGGDLLFHALRSTTSLWYCQSESLFDVSVLFSPPLWSRCCRSPPQRQKLVFVVGKQH